MPITAHNIVGSACYGTLQHAIVIGIITDNLKSDIGCYDQGAIFQLCSYRIRILR